MASQYRELSTTVVAAVQSQMEAIMKNMQGFFLNAGSVLLSLYPILNASPTTPVGQLLGSASGVADVQESRRDSYISA